MSTSQNEDDFWTDLDIPVDEFRALGYRVIDMITEYYSSVRTLRVCPQTTPGEVAGLFSEELPRTGQEPNAILDEWIAKVLPNATHMGSPRFFGFVNGSGTMMATLAETLSASVNMNLGAWKPSPAATEIERRTIEWLAESIGYPTSCGGLFLSGGTMANLTAILTALRNVAPYDTTQDGLQSESRNGRFTIYMSDHEGHISIVRVADMLNLGRSTVRRVPGKEDFTMDVNALEHMLDEDIARGYSPFCVVANVGSINVGAIDPLKELAGICARRGLWLHADGANGAFGAMLPEKRSLFEGLERVDSLTLDPHKWLYIPYECGCLLVKNPEHLRRAYSLHAPYLRGILPTEQKGFDHFEYGPQMSRGFRALKVWMTLKHYGVEGYHTLHRQNLRCIEYLDQLVRASEDFQALHEPLLFIYSFRYVPKRYSLIGEYSPEKSELIDAYLDRLNQRLADGIQASGIAFVMTTSLRGRTVLRLSVCSHRTTLADIDLVFNTLHAMGTELDMEERSMLG